MWKDDCFSLSELKVTFVWQQFVLFGANCPKIWQWCKREKQHTVTTTLKKQCVFCSIHPSIHPFSSSYLTSSHSGSKLFQTSSYPAMFYSSSWGIQKRCTISLESFGSTWGLLPVGHARITSEWRHPGGTLIPNHFSQFLQRKDTASPLSSSSPYR